MSSNTIDGTRVVIGKPERRGLLGQHSDGELVVAGTVMGLGLLTLVVMPMPMSLLPGIVLLLTGPAIIRPKIGLRRGEGRTLYRWLPLLTRYHVRRRSGRHKWLNDTPERGMGVGKVDTLDLPTPPGVGRLKWMKTTMRNGDQLAVILSPDTRDMTAAVQVAGSAGGIADPEEYEALLASWDAVLGQLANSEGFANRVAVYSRCVPTDPEAHARWVRARGSGSAPQTVIDSYDRPDIDMAAVTDTYTHHIVVRVRVDRAVTRAAEGHGGGDEGLARVMLEEVEDIAAQVSECGIQVLGACSPEQTAAYIRNNYDPDQPIDDDTAAVRSAFPRSTRSTARALHTPGWVHATAWMCQGPMHEVRLTFLAPLTVQMPGVVRTIAVVKELVPSDVAIERTLNAKTDDTARTRRREKLGKVEDARDTKQAGRLDERMDDLADGGAGTDVAVYVTVSARDETDLERLRRRTGSAAGKASCRLEWLDYEHDRGFVNTLPFARGLK